jgi:hypothetical protein
VKINKNTLSLSQQAEGKNPDLLKFPDEMRFVKDASPQNNIHQVSKTEIIIKFYGHRNLNHTFH